MMVRTLRKQKESVRIITKSMQLFYEGKCKKLGFQKLGYT